MLYERYSMVSFVCLRIMRNSSAHTAFRKDALPCTLQSNFRTHADITYRLMSLNKPTFSIENFKAGSECMREVLVFGGT